MKFARILEYQLPEIIESSSIPIENEKNAVLDIITALVVQTYAYYEITPNSTVVSLVAEDIFTLAPCINQNELIYAFKIGRIELGKNNMGKFSAETIKGWIIHYLNTKRRPYMEEKIIEQERRLLKEKEQAEISTNRMFTAPRFNITNDKGEVVEVIDNPFQQIADRIFKRNKELKFKDREHNSYINSLNNKKFALFKESMNNLLSNRDKMSQEEFERKHKEINDRDRYYLHLEFWKLIEKLFKI